MSNPETPTTAPTNPTDEGAIVLNTEQNIGKAVDILGEQIKLAEAEEPADDVSDGTVEPSGDADDTSDTPDTIDSDENPQQPADGSGDDSIDDQDTDDTDEPSVDPRLGKSWDLLISRETKLTQDKKELRKEIEDLKELKASKAELDKLKADPVGYLTSLGVTFDGSDTPITNSGSDPSSQQQISPELDKRMKTMEEERAADKLREVQVAEQGYLNKVTEYAAEHCDMVSALGMEGEAFAYAQMRYEEDSTVISPEEAAQAIESFLQERMTKHANTANTDESPDESAAKPVKTPKKKSKKKKSKTLKNNIESSAPNKPTRMTEEDRIRKAIALLD